MATYSVTATLSSGGSTTTQNVSTGDTVNVTVAAGLSDALQVSTSSISGCSVSPSADYSAPFTFSITNFTSTSYSANFIFFNEDDFTAYTATVSGSVSTSTGPGLGVTISNYTSNPTRYYSNGTTYTAATTTVVATSAYTHGLANCASNTIYWASYTSGASGDTATYSTISPIGRTYNTNTSRTLAGMGGGSNSIALPSSYGGSRVYIWAVVVGTTITSSTTMTCTGASYYIEYPDDAISLSPSTTSISSSSTSNVTVNVTGDTSGTQYRLYTNNINRWVSTYNGGGSSTTDFTISYDEASTGQPGTGFTELPTAGNTYTYFSQCRVTAGVNDGVNNGGALWINTGDSFTVSRSAAGTYTVTSPSSVNEGSNLSFSITTTNITNGTTVGWSLAGLQSGDYTTSSSDPIAIYNNSATVTLAIVNDNVTDGNKTAVLTLDPQDSAGNSTGSPSSSTTVVDTSNPGGGGGTGSGTSQSGGTGSFGLLIRNSLDTATIIDGSSRITNFLDVDTINTLSQSSKNMFTSFDCSEKTETGVIVTWTGNSWTAPTFTRRSAALGGIAVTKNTNDTSSSTSGTATVYLIRY